MERSVECASRLSYEFTPWAQSLLPIPLRGHEQENLLLRAAAILPLRSSRPLHGRVCWQLPEVSEIRAVAVMLPCLTATWVMAGRWGGQIPPTDHVCEARPDLD